MAIRDESYATQ